jgi:hypothetical protein
MRNYLTLLFSFLCFAVTAQEKKAEEYIGWKSGKVQLHTISNKQFSCTFMLNADSIKALVFDNNLKLVQQFTIYKKNNEKFLGGFIKNNSICLFMDNASSPGLHSWLFSITDNTIKENTVPFEINKEKIIGRLSSNEHFFYFTISKKSPEFVLYIFTNELHYDILRYTVAADTWDKMRGNSFLRNNNSFNIEKVDTEGECDVEIAQSPNKIYVRNDTLLLLSNTIKSVTSVFEFDLTNNNLGFRQIAHNVNTIKEQPEEDNSFLLDNKLYYVAATPAVLSVQVADFYTGDILKTFRCNYDEEISFKNTPIIQEGSYFLNITKELTKTKQLLRKMGNGKAVITATRDIANRQVQVLVGSYSPPNSGGIGITYMPGSPAGTMMLLPTGGFTRNSWAKSARFKMLLNTETSEHVAGKLPPDINDKIEAYTKDMKIPDDVENLFVRNGNYHYVFYNREKRVLSIVVF